VLLTAGTLFCASGTGSSAVVVGTGACLLIACSVVAHSHRRIDWCGRCGGDRLLASPSRAPGPAADTSRSWQLPDRATLESPRVRTSTRDPPDISKSPSRRARRSRRRGAEAPRGSREPPAGAAIGGRTQAVPHVVLVRDAVRLSTHQPRACQTTHSPPVIRANPAPTCPFSASRLWLGTRFAWA
jgi:hypothetical protein